ncbi:type IV secretory system conjugative DNA transfer family protein [Bengtsoniella intestinalis]|uniref:VirD4-like conjugal transfer protein, CD1115 family n=1 Tax=Bengtsoniella intestinalis TaxID=3073143 RepID=UPI00391EECBD
MTKEKLSMLRPSNLLKSLAALVEKNEGRLEKKAGRWLDRNREKLIFYIPMGTLAWYLYGMFINSVHLGTASTFNTAGEEIESIWVFNPFFNFFAVFTPYGLGITAISVLLICLITKKGYSKFSGYRFIKDPRGFHILPDGTHGTSGFMSKKEQEQVVFTEPLSNLDGTVLGKQKEHPLDDNRYAEYITLRPNTRLTEHTMIYGATGSGKSRGFVKPFILQCAKRKDSLVLVDPKGEFYETMSGYLRDQGYEVRLFNLLDMENSDAWNCLADDGDDPNMVQAIAEVIINNTSGEKETQDFWAKAELNLLVAMIHYVRGLCDTRGQPLPVQQRSLGAIYRLLSNESLQRLDETFSGLPVGHPAKAPYGLFKQANRQIWGNIAIGLGNRLSVFQNPLVDKISAYHEIDLTLPGQKPCAYFCAISDQDSSLEFLSSLFFSQLFTRLMGYARRNCKGGRLPTTVNVCLEEFCNIGKLTDFKKVLSVCRSRGIYCQIIVQSIAQLSERYPRNEWEELIGNSDVQICLGCNDQKTAEYISKKCGTVTICVQNNQFPLTPLFSPIYATTRPYSQTKSNTQRALMMPDEILQMDNAKCLVFLRGQKPMMLYKIIPDEFTAFAQLHFTPVGDHIPLWRQEVVQPPRSAPPPTPAPTPPPMPKPKSKHPAPPKPNFPALSPDQPLGFAEITLDDVRNLR